MTRRMASADLSTRGARIHFAVAVALSAVLPSLTLFLILQPDSGARPLSAVQWSVAGASISAVMLAGYILLWRYPATIIRLRACLQSVVNGDLPDMVDLAAGEQDVMAIEDALNLVLQRLRHRLSEVQSQKSRLEDELFRAQKLEAIGTLAAGITHEISTPLQFVSNNVQFIDKACRELLLASGSGEANTPTGNTLTFLREELPRACRQTEEGVGRITQIVKAIKEFSRGDDDEAKVPVDLNETIANTVEVTRNEWKYHAEMVTDYDHALPPVSCFPGEIKRTVVNLILNAVQAIIDSREAGEGDPAKGRIRLATRQSGQDAVISITDNGCGIPPVIRKRIFDPFFTTREVGAGKGFGLAFAHAAIVERHGGRISFVTEEAKGSTFTVALPLSGVESGRT